ncbi:hypothetical protein PENDEC_c037G00317 [Penicillium decumbens]|uniref:Uncharacterized protein n=1 Tax=Penicillium decumbens TaxID=69771 RepID=A0A1V6NRN7_PENDC|nr:hypothetical protein PENDEC_c037G00317 [Penicillium decumbens]
MLLSLITSSLNTPDSYTADDDDAQSHQSEDDFQDFEDPAMDNA